MYYLQLRPVVESFYSPRGSYYWTVRLNTNVPNRNNVKTTAQDERRTLHKPWENRS